MTARISALRELVVVVGAGPGVSASVARRFAREGFDIGLIGLDSSALAELVADLAPFGVGVAAQLLDIRDGERLRDAIETMCPPGKRIKVLHFNPSVFREKDPLALSPEELSDDVSVGVGALLTAVQAARPFMVRGSRITATGSVAADSPWSRAASLGIQKAGLRNLVRSIDASLHEAGIRAVSVTVHGALASTGAFTPDRVAQAIFEAAAQEESLWRAEVSYGAVPSEVLAIS